MVGRTEGGVQVHAPAAAEADVRVVGVLAKETVDAEILETPRRADPRVPHDLLTGKHHVSGANMRRLITDQHEPVELHLDLRPEIDGVEDRGAGVAFYLAIALDKRAHPAEEALRPERPAGSS